MLFRIFIIHKISAAHSRFTMPNHVVGRILLELGSLVANITITRRRREQLFDSFQSNLGSVHVQHRRANRRRNKTKQFFHYYFAIYLKRKIRPLHNPNFHKKNISQNRRNISSFERKTSLCRGFNRNTNSSRISYQSDRRWDHLL